MYIYKNYITIIIISTLRKKKYFIKLIITDGKKNIDLKIILKFFILLFKIYLILYEIIIIRNIIMIFIIFYYIFY